MGSDRDDKPIDAIDLIINLLKEHEKTLDGISKGYWFLRCR
jgi:hypothetical protein